jgi:hypothetical protein
VIARFDECACFEARLEGFFLGRNFFLKLFQAAKTYGSKNRMVLLWQPGL